MIPWVLLGTAVVPGGDGELRLMRRGDEFAIFIGTVELMGTRRVGSEAALAAETCCRLAVARPRVLIGGLGLGYTLRAALEALSPRAQVVVAELVPGVVSWARGPLAHLHGDSLDDQRVTILEDDVARPMAGGGWDAILLDVDNGPAGQTRTANDALYAPRGLAAAYRALRPRGLLSVWSTALDPAFTERLRRAGFTVDEVRPSAHGKRGTRHVIWLCRRPEAP